MIAIFIILMSFAEAQIYSEGGSQVLYKRSEVEAKRSIDEKVEVKKKPKDAVTGGNLPNYYVRSNQPSRRAIVAPNDTHMSQMPNLKTGDMLLATIPHSIIAFPDEKSPVLAVVTEGPFKGAKLIGQSRLEPNSKRIFIDFQTMTFANHTAKVTASALTSDGVPGFEGEYHSQELKYFTGDFLSSMTAAYFDSQVPRYNSFFGTIEDTSTDSAIKKGLAAGAKSSAERFREKLKKTPEFAELKGSFGVKLIVF